MDLEDSVHEGHPDTVQSPNPTDRPHPEFIPGDDQRVLLQEERRLLQLGEKNVAGLALSGGGIRSAIFCLGVLQVLARAGLLKKFDFLSTVSGGGYVGGSLTWLTHAVPGASVDFDRNFPYGIQNPKNARELTARNPFVNYLRRRGNYLTPGDGINLFSGAAVVIRGALLNMLVWLPIAAFVWFWLILAYLETGKVGPVVIDLLGFPLAGLLAAIFVAVSIAYSISTRFESHSLWRLIGFNVIIVGLAILDVYWRWDMTDRLPYGPNLDFAGVPAAVTVAVVFAVGVIMYGLALFRRREDRAGKGRGGLNVRVPRYGLRRAIEKWMGSYLLVILSALAVGIVPNIDAIIVWIAKVGPDSLEGFIKDSLQRGGVGYLLIGFAVAYFGFRQAGRSGHPGLWTKGTMWVALVFATYGLARTTFDWAQCSYEFLWDIAVQGGGRCPVHGEMAGVILTIAGLALVPIAVITGFVVNINYISLSRYYRDRLMEAFMPNVRKPAGTTPAIAAKLEPDTSGLATEANAAVLSRFFDGDAEATPYHLINTNLILVDSKDPTFKSRRGDNFLLSPLYCGSRATGWRKTESFMGDRLTLPTAIAVSGAAANPNSGVGGQGATTNRLVSFVMALLNIRLGIWVPNPNEKFAKRQRNRPNHFRPGFGETFFLRALRETKKYLQISDGGHFDNTGIYELVRRKARFILLCDMGADPNFEFADLTNAIVRVQEDFGVIISFDENNRLDRLIARRDDPRGKQKFPSGVEPAQQGFVVGDIDYGPGNKGALIVVKSTFIEGLDVETCSYRESHPDFPDQTTADQFFDEKQFDAYQRLGYAVAQQMVEKIKTDTDGWYGQKDALSLVF